MAIPSKTQRYVQHGDVLEVIQTGIRTEDASWVIGLLTDIYSNTYLAPLREYCTNALDSHIEAGIKDPIEVTLPTATNLFLLIKDHGMGLSVDDVREIYANYGHSTKRMSNEVTGQLGIGCKSGLTYADTFTITAIKNGVKTVAVMTKNKAGVGEIRVMDTRSTNEHNGVNIMIPVDRYDIRNFQDEAEELFKYWRPGTVLVDGNEPDRTKFDDGIWLDPDVHVGRGTNMTIVMGNVPYEVDSGQFDIPRGFDITAWVPNGAVDFTPSREELQYTALTNETLEDTKSFVLLKFAESVADEIEESPTPWKQFSVFHEWGDSQALKAALKRRFISVNYQSHIPLNGTHAWTYKPHGWETKKASRSEHSYSMYSLHAKNVIIITGFTAQTVAAQARERILEFFSDRTGKPQFAIFNETVDLSAIEGRPDVYVWDDIVAATAKPKASKGTGAPRQRAKYPVWSSGSGVGSMETVVGDVLFTPGGRHDRWDMERFSEQFPNHQVVQLKLNQVSSFCKRHPNAQNIHDFKVAEFKRIKNALTEEDKIKNQGQPYGFNLKPDELGDVIDPAIQSWVELTKKPESATLKEAKRLRVPVDEPKTRAPWQRYEGVGSIRGLQDKVLYMNAKYKYGVANMLHVMSGTPIPLSSL